MTAMQKEDQAEIRSLSGNGSCADCSRKRPQWASITYGILVCLECSGAHRSLGTHVSFVRSVQMDSWSDDQLEKMKRGGNLQCEEFLSKYSVPKKTPVREKYSSPPAELYRNVLKARIEGNPEPTELPTRKEEENKREKTKYEGFGSSPHPSELNDDEKGMSRTMKNVAMGIVPTALALAAFTLRKK